LKYKKILQLFILLTLYSCTKELDITDFTSEFGSFEQEYRIEALMLPQDDTAIIRIDKTIAIDDENLFNCEDDNNNWVASGCICGDNSKEETGNFICPLSAEECGAAGGLWTLTETNPFIDGYCDISLIQESNCMSNSFDLYWTIIDDVGEDGVIGDPSDEDEDGNLEEPSVGEDNGIPDCGEPNVDDLEEITEGGFIHEDACNTVQIIYNDNEICNFIYSPAAGTVYEGAGLFEFSDGSGCQEGDLLFDGSELNNFYYDYGAWVPNNCSDNFFTHYMDGAYSLNIECADKTIVSKSPEVIPYPVVFVDEDSLEEEAVGTCVETNNQYECLSQFKVDNLVFELQQENQLDYVSTSTFYQAVQYFDPYYSCFFDGEASWTYYHGHPGVAYPPSDETNHFPSGNSPIIFTNNEIVVSSTQEDIGCYQYRMFTFSEGYKNYYFSQLDLKDPVRSNLRQGQDGTGEVVIGAFGAMSGETITFEIIGD